MSSRSMQNRTAEVADAAAAFGATMADSDEKNFWDVAVAGKHIGVIRYEPRARVWLATAGTESTVGDLTGCLRFVVRRN
jgi:hypothetical protein